jgi:N-hydroxyarylamine O-acetyltransferase
MSSFDRDSYFKRIGYSGSAAPTLETLQQIHALHVQAIPFENLNPFLKWPVRLDIDSLQQKLVRDRRGGYCYEQNLLFRHALQDIGFHVIGLAARVLWSVPDDVVLPRTHMLVRVNIGEQACIADVGFGGLTLTSPLRLESDVEQSTSHEPFRLVADVTEFILQAKLVGAWKPLYRFSLEEQLLPDYEMANWYVSCHPNSRFVNALIAARTAPEGRYTLLNNDFKVHYLNGKTETRLLGTVAELRDVLAGPLGIALPDTAELDPALERVTAAY